VIELPDAQATQTLGSHLGRALGQLDAGLVIALQGKLGVGKTALVRATLAALGHDGIVVSPTYTLLESYPLGRRRLHHLDLYRLATAEELEYVGLRDLAAGDDWFMIEWPAHGRGHLPAFDLTIELHYAGAARRARLHPYSQLGRTIVDTINI